jgi:hypothetical protein
LEGKLGEKTKGKTIKLRLTDEEEGRWLESARRSNLTLSGWIRRRCNGGEEIGRVTIEHLEEAKPSLGELVLEAEAKPIVDENPVAVAFRNMANKKAERPGKDYYEICPHNMVKAGCPRCAPSKGR